MPQEVYANYSIRKLSILDKDGKADEKLLPKLSPVQLKEMYTFMVLARTLDDKILKLQRQGRIGTYSPGLGQEAIPIGSAYAAQKQDWSVQSFREHGMMIVRGVPLLNIMLYFGGDERNAKYPIDNILPNSVPVGSQTLHAVGLAMGIQYKQKDAVAMAYFGDGGTSEGDFHEALNFAGTLNLPCVFICQNNQWAISVPRKSQTHAETIAQKAIAYGIEGIQVDGNDILAVYAATKEALDRARSGKGPTLIECVTYRMGDHTTADDATRYRSAEEVQYWRERDPLLRMQKYLFAQGILSPPLDEQIKNDAIAKVEAAVVQYESFPAPSVDDIFDYHYMQIPADLEAQKKELHAFLETIKPLPNGREGNGGM